MAILIQAQPGSFPIYMLTDAEIADPTAVAELTNAAPGTMAVTAGFNTIKQLDASGTWVESGS